MKLRRIIPIMVALVAMLSGVAAVSAFEAHTINVTAHVENALTVDGTAVAFGTVFPEEWLQAHRNIALSSSFLAQPDTSSEEGVQPRKNSVSYTVYGECKEKTPAIPGEPGTPATYYLWMGPMLWIDRDGGNYKQLPDLANPVCTEGQVIATGFTGTLTHSGVLYNPASPRQLVDSEQDLLSLSIDVPVFEGYYNEWTDVCDKLRPNFGGADGIQSGSETPTLAASQTDPRHATRTDGAGFKCQVPSMIIDGPDGTSTDPRWNIAGVDVGVDIKIQVTGIGPS